MGTIQSVLKVMGWLARFAILMALLTMLAPAQPRALLGEPQTVQSAQPLLCVHTRLMEEVDEWKIQRTLQLTREMGADTVVEFFPWAYIESEAGQYAWASVDRIVRHATNQGVRIIARMGLVPAWARQTTDERETTLNELPAESYDEFARFVAAFAERYEGTINDIIIWNEPNLTFEWGYRAVDAAAYVAMLREVYTSVKARVPNVQIMAAPLAPTLEPLGSAAGLNEVLYFEAMYAAGLADVSDAIAMHTYGFTEAPSAAPDFAVLNFRRAELLYDVMRYYGDEATPVYITETGWNDDPRWTRAVSPAQRIGYTIEAYEYADTQWEWLEKLCLWVMRFPAPTNTYPDGFTLVTPGFELRPIYTALQAFGRNE
jgi:polysaccharide biosynthesis protein PslG